MKQLIINADDFGLHPLINKGIIEGHRRGMITSTSLMPSAPAFEEAVQLAKETPLLGVGIHLTLVGGVKPVCRSGINSLLNSEGVFAEDYTVFVKKWYTDSIKKAEVEKELRAQIEKVLAAGIVPTHIDSHQHMHVLPGIAGLVIRLCGEYGFSKIRMPGEGMLWSGGFKAGLGRKIGRDGLSFCTMLAKAKAKRAGLIYPQHFFGMLAGGNLNAALVANILQNLPDGTSEIMTHPGSNNILLAQKFKWGYHWHDELNAFLDAANKKTVQEHGIKLINFGGL